MIKELKEMIEETLEFRSAHLDSVENSGDVDCHFSACKNVESFNLRLSTIYDVLCFTEHFNEANEMLEMLPQSDKKIIGMGLGIEIEIRKHVV